MRKEKLDKILFCPYCHKHTKGEINDDSNLRVRARHGVGCLPHRKYYVVECINCGLVGPTITSKNGTIDSWNSLPRASFKK